MDSTGQLRLEQTLRQAGVSLEFVRQWRAAIERGTQAQPTGADRATRTRSLRHLRSANWSPYESSGGRLWQLSRTVTASGEELIQRAAICDFTAHVVAEVVTEPEGEGGAGRRIRHTGRGRRTLPVHHPRHGP